MKITAMLLAVLVLASCGTPEPGSPRAQLEVMQAKTAADTAAVQKTVAEVPDWYAKPPVDDLAMLAAGTATSADMQFAIDKAVVIAKRGVADRIGGRISADLKNYLSESGSVRDPVTVERSERVIKDLVADIDLAGYDVYKQVVVPDGTRYRAFALVRYPLGDANRAVVDGVRKDTDLRARLEASDAFKKLEADVEAARRVESRPAP